MVLPAQFELGLELTNLVNPISQAMSALGSLAVIDAIKKSGSDFITETKLANLIGRHRIDPVIKFHFREMVAKSDQSVISRYLDIILESGSGPTVQEALKNPALFSMVIQLSALAFAHDNESLTNAIVEAIENIVQESGGDGGIVPDYVSLLGTLRACQQQTAAFRWALLYEAVEEKMRKANKELSKSRSLPIAILQGLFMWLKSLQSFPEHRLLHLRCDTGVSTVVVWCHHVLGLSLIINAPGTEISFGDAPYNLIVEDSQGHLASVSLMDPLDSQEPLFTLQNDQTSNGISYEHRAEAYGYGAKFLQFNGLVKWKWKELARWVISRSVEACEPNSHDFGLRYPSRIRLLTAGRILFALDENTAGFKGDRPVLSLQSHEQLVLDALVIIVITFARISEDDLEKYREIPLVLNIFPIFPGITIMTDFVYKFNNLKYILNLLDSFELLSLLLLGGQLHHEEYIKPAVLISAWGWSVFLDSINAVDPFDVSVDTLRVLRGVPSRRGSHRARIIDGPQGVIASTQIWSRSDETLSVHLVEGVSTAKKGVILVGHYSDAFQITQQLICHNERNLRYRFGFREMAECSIRCSRLPPCQCHKSEGKDSSEANLMIIDERLAEKDALVRRIHPKERASGSADSGSVRVFDSEGWEICFVYVSENPVARWLQLQALHQSIDRLPNKCHIAVRGHNTCVDCAIRNSGFLRRDTFVLL